MAPLSPVLRPSVRYAAAAGLTAVAGALLILVPPVKQTPFLFFMGAVAVSAYYLGVGPSILSTFMGAAISAYWYLRPIDLQDVVRSISFVVISLLIATISAKRRRAEQSARERLQRFDTLANEIPELVWTCDAAGRCDYVSQRWLDYTGTTLKQNLGYGWMKVLHPDDVEATGREWSRCVTSLSPYRGEVRIRRADGEYRLNIANALPLSTGNSISWIGSCTDIEDIKRRHELLVRTEKLAVAGRLAATVAHEINNPLEAALNLLYLIDSDQSASPSVRDCAKLANEELQRITQIVQQTLGSHREGVAATLVNVAKIADGVVRLYERRALKRRVAIEPRIERDVLAIVAVEGEIRQIIANLVGNAIDAVPDAGRVLVGVHTSSPNGRYNVKIVVSDNGNGIDPGHQQKIFDPFFTTKASTGTGLGLWLTKQLVEKYGGTIRLRSKVGHGTTFVVSFPALRPAVAA